VVGKKTLGVLKVLEGTPSHCEVQGQADYTKEVRTPNITINRFIYKGGVTAGGKVGAWHQFFLGRDSLPEKKGIGETRCRKLLGEELWSHKGEHGQGGGGGRS